MTCAVSVGDTLPAWSIPITPTLVVSTAIATRDFQDVHHDRDIAQAAGSQDIFVNILTSTAMVERYVTDWAHQELGHWDTDVRGIAIRLGAPAYPYDTLTFNGEVTAVEDGVVTLSVTGDVSLGHHVIGSVKISTSSINEKP